MKNDSSLMKKYSAPARVGVCVFVGVHILMCILRSCFLPTGSRWNVIFLEIELAFAALAAVCCAVSLLMARRGEGVGAVIAPLRSAFRQPVFFLAAGWCVVSFIAAFWAMSQGLGGLYHNGRYLFYLAVSLLVFFPLGLLLGGEDRRVFLHLVFDLCLLCFSLFLAYGFYRFFRGDFTFTALFGRVYRLKKARMRLGQNNNTTGCYSVFFLVMGVYRLGTMKKPWQKALTALLLLPVCIAFIVVESRSAAISGATAMGLLSGTAVYRRRKDKGAAAILLSVAVFFLTAGAFMGAFFGLHKLLNRLQMAYIKTFPVRVSKKATPSHTITVEDLVELNGRKEIWLGVILRVLKDPGLLLHGCTQSSTNTVVESIIGKSYNTHNQFLEVLLAYGLPSMLLFVAWLFPVAGKSISVGLDSDSPDNRWMLPAVLLLLVVNNLVETMLVARGHFVGGFFFLIAGYVCGMAPKKKKKEQADEK